LPAFKKNKEVFMGDYDEKKFCSIILFLLSVMLISNQLSAKDYLSNQSPEYHRTFSRNASIDSADIVNYNPAGTVF